MSKYDSVDKRVKWELLSYMLECCQGIPGVQGLSSRVRTVCV
jgi:hypothetical protein